MQPTSLAEMKRLFGDDVDKLQVPGMEIDTVSKYGINILQDFKQEDWPVRPQVYEILKRRGDSGLEFLPLTHCLPGGVPLSTLLSEVTKIVQTPGLTLIMLELGGVRQIYTDGRKHLEDQWATYTGDSVGHWEGDTLVFTTVALKGFRDKDVILDRTGLVLSDQSHATTRIRKTDLKTIQVEMTIEDPKALTKPWVVTKQFQKMPAGTRVYDYGCAENNRNPADVDTGKTLILGPDGKPLNK